LWQRAAEHCLLPHAGVPQESFLYQETKPVFELLEQASARSGVSRGQVFEDFLHMSVCALSGGRMEEQYLATVAKHTEGKPGKRGCDSIAHAFGTLVAMMEKTRLDILGDLFQGAITYGEKGQFLTPEHLCKAMAKITIADEAEKERSGRKSVCDPCVGSGRMLLAVADMKPHWDFVGQDADLRCVRMTAINLGLRNLYGYVVWSNSLTLEKRLVYRTGFNLRGVIREIPIEDSPAPVQQLAMSLGSVPESVATDPDTAAKPKAERIDVGDIDEPPASTGKQLFLFWVDWSAIPIVPSSICTDKRLSVFQVSEFVLMVTLCKEYCSSYLDEALCVTDSRSRIESPESDFLLHQRRLCMPKKQTAQRTRSQHAPPEIKIGPFAGGIGVAIWLNTVDTDDGPKKFRSITIAPRRYQDRETGEWKDAGSLNPSDLPALIFALQKAQEYVFTTPLPGQDHTGAENDSRDTTPFWNSLLSGNTPLCS
jgi:hypothetical protein